jgi:hypothetical protein
VAVHHNRFCCGTGALSSTCLELNIDGIDRAGLPIRGLIESTRKKTTQWLKKQNGT